MINHLQSIIPLWERLKDTKKPVILYGTGNGADKILDYVKSFNIEIQGIFASDEFVRGQEFRGYKVLKYEEAKNRFGDMIVLQAFGTHLPEVISKIKEIIKEQEYLVPDIEVCGQDFFTPEVYLKNYDKFSQTYDMLYDMISLSTWDNLMLFKLSGDPRYLLKTNIGDNLEKNLIKDNEIYSDVGAYDGDTINDFIENVSEYKSIYALEPDSHNFKKLYNNFKRNKNVNFYNIAAFDCNDVLTFNELKGRQSSASDNGKKIVACRKLDDLCPDASYIKIDAEGSEAYILKGCRRLMKENKTKFKVAAYHKNTDLLLPLEIKKIRPDYKVYLRHGSALPAWDLNYYFI